MCGIVAFWDKTGRYEAASGQIVLTMLQALACRGPDSAGMAMIGPEPELDWADEWRVRIARGDEHSLERVALWGQLVPVETGGLWEQQAGLLRFRFRPAPGVTPVDLERILGAR